MERLPHDDRLALLPVADLFNHADSGCESAFSPRSYTITADRAYGTGEEVHICYGSHSNDFLLAEYGFMLTENRWDAVRLDDVILPSLGKQQKDVLEEKGFLGNYILSPETAGCFRTQVALRLLCCTYKQWQRFADGEVDDEASQRKVNVLLLEFLNRFVKMIYQALEDIDKLNIGQTSQRELLAWRWRQMETMVIQTIKRLNG